LCKLLNRLLLILAIRSLICCARRLASSTRPFFAIYTVWYEDT
jgi:hypothetical protein